MGPETPSPASTIHEHLQIYTNNLAQYADEKDTVSSEMRRQLPKHACSLCARRKVRCDRGDPCNNCLRAQTKCSYDEGDGSSRSRKRASNKELKIRLSLYEDLMRKHNIDFGRYANIWVSSTPGPGKEEEEVQTEVSEVSETVYLSGPKNDAQEHTTK